MHSIVVLSATDQGMRITPTPEPMSVPPIDAFHDSKRRAIDELRAFGVLHGRHSPHSEDNRQHNADSMQRYR